MSTSYTDSVRINVIKWLESVRYKKEGWGRFAFNAKAISPYSLHASNMAIRLYDSLDLLSDVSDDLKGQAAAYILSSQDKEDGYFKDSFEDVSVYTGFNTWEEIWNQRSTVTEALRLLGYSPALSLPVNRFFDFSAEDFLSRIRELNWENPGKCAEKLSASITAYGDSLEPGERKDTSPPFASVFTFLEQEILDSETGLPTKRGCSNPQYLIVGVARMLLAYIYFGRLYPYPEKVIDYILSRQDASGDLAPEAPSVAANYNCMWILRELNYDLEGMHRVEDIQDAGNQLAHRLLSGYQKIDGGFSFTPESCQKINYSIRVSEALPISDMTGTMMAYRCLDFVDEWNAGIIFGRVRRPFEY